MSNKEVTKALEASIQRAKASVELGQALERLLTNRDFRTVIEQGYFKEEAIRLVHLRADPSMTSSFMQESIVKQMDAIGALVQYFAVIRHQSAMAGRSIESDELTLEELHLEDAA
jgi:phytoene dehydrogenase-like protein